MPVTTLSAHFDGKQIIIDEPFKLKPNTKLLVTVLPETKTDRERNETPDENAGWSQISLQGLEAAYSKNEVDYSLNLIKEPNPKYERR